jgi:hypothetical protein
VEKSGNVYLFIVLKSLFILSGRPQLSTFRRKSKTLSYLDLCSMNRPLNVAGQSVLSWPDPQNNQVRRALSALTHSHWLSLTAGADFMKPFQPKFTNRTQYVLVIMTLHGVKIPGNTRFLTII